jgi:hypothetical protein
MLGYAVVLTYISNYIYIALTGACKNNKVLSSESNQGLELIKIFLRDTRIYRSSITPVIRPANIVVSDPYCDQ